MNSNPKNYVPEFFDNTSTSYDQIVKYCTFGKDKGWKNKILEFLKRDGLFLDLACGTGILTRKIAEKFPNSSIIGIDITKSYLDIAKKNSKSYNNISYLHQDAEELNLTEKFDYITASYLPKYCDPSILIQQVDENLKSGGIIILHDFTYPTNTLVAGLWELYFVVLNLLGNLIPSWKKAFEKLPLVIKSSKWVEEYEKKMKQTGWNVTRINLTWNSSSILVGEKLG